MADWEEQVELQLLEPFGCFKGRAAGLDCGCRAGLCLFSRARTNCGAESEPEGRGWRSCWGRGLSRLPVGAPPPTSGSALTSPASCRPKCVLVPVPGTSFSSLCLAHSLPFRYRPVAFLTGLWFRAGTTHLPLPYPRGLLWLSAWHPGYPM